MDIWYTFEPTGDGTLTVSTCNQADYATRLAAYTGTCDDLQIAGCNDDAPGCLYPTTSIMDVPAVCGEPVLIRVGSFSVYMGTGTLTLTFEGSACAAGCDGDTNGDDRVDVDDVINVITSWGTDDPGADVNQSGVVDVDDMVMVIVGWGPCS
jgi:hypothetical protein